MICALMLIATGVVGLTVFGIWQLGIATDGY